MPNHSAKVREETPHETQSTKIKTLKLNGNVSHGSISRAIKRRAQSLISNMSIDAGTRIIIRYGLETNDPSLPELVRRVDEGETLSEAMDFSEIPIISGDDSIDEKIEALADMICRAGDDPAMKSAALLVLMSTLEIAQNPKALANTAKHYAFSRCGELNLCGMVDVQAGVVEAELFAENSPAF